MAGAYRNRSDRRFPLFVPAKYRRVVDPDQWREGLAVAKANYRRAEARLAKHGSETSVGADLLTRQTNLPVTHGGGTRSQLVRTSREETPVRRMGSAGPAICAVQLPGHLPRELAMESFEVDIDPAQIVRWIMVERKTSPSTFKTLVTRASEVRAIPDRSEYHLGDEEREDLSEMNTTATLEIVPAHERDGWLLTVTVEDEIGPRMSADAAAAEQQIDLGTFYSEFIRPGRGIANVVAHVENALARQHVTRLLEAIEQDRHTVDQASASRR